MKQFTLRIHGQAKKNSNSLQLYFLSDVVKLFLGQNCIHVITLELFKSYS